MNSDKFFSLKKILSHASPVYGFLAVLVFLIFLQSLKQNFFIQSPSRDSQVLSEQYPFYFVQNRLKDYLTDIYLYDHGRIKRMGTIPRLVEWTMSPDGSTLAGVIQRSSFAPNELFIKNLKKNTPIIKLKIFHSISDLLWTTNGQSLMFKKNRPSNIFFQNPKNYPLETFNEEIELFNIWNKGSQPIVQSANVDKERRIMIEPIAAFGSQPKIFFGLRRPPSFELDTIILSDSNDSNHFDDQGIIPKQENIGLSYSVDRQFDRIAVASDQTLFIINAKSEIEKSIDTKDPSRKNLSPVSPDGRFLIYRSEKSTDFLSLLVLVDLEKGDLIEEIVGPSEIQLNHSAWTPDSSALFANSNKGLIGLVVQSRTIEFIGLNKNNPFPIQRMEQFLSFTASPTSSGKKN